MQCAEEQLTLLMREKEPRLKEKEVFLEKGFRSEHDAVHLMHILSNLYEPTHLLSWLKGRADK